MAIDKFYELSDKDELMKMISENKNSVSNIFNELILPYTNNHIYRI